MYYLQHERPCCIGYTNSSRRREFVYPIQHGRECCKWLVKFMKCFLSKRILRYVYLRFGITTDACWNAKLYGTI